MTIISPISTLNTASTTAQTIINGALRLLQVASTEDNQMAIDWNAASTKRGLVWVITALVGSIFIFMGKPVDQLLLLAGAVAGGLGLVLKD